MGQIQAGSGSGAKLSGSATLVYILSIPSTKQRFRENMMKRSKIVKYYPKKYIPMEVY